MMLPRFESEKLTLIKKKTYQKTLFQICLFPMNAAFRKIHFQIVYAFVAQRKLTVLVLKAHTIELFCLVLRLCIVNHQHLINND